MFVRWKKRISEAENEQWKYEYKDHKLVSAHKKSKEEMPYTLSAYLMQSVRINGKPRQKNVAFLGSIKSKDLEKGEPIYWLWNKAEDTLSELGSNEKIKEQVYQALAQKTPRPSTEALQKARKESEAWDAYFASTPDKPKAPPFLTDDTTEEINGLTILWDRDGPYRSPTTGETTREELYHVYLAYRKDKSKDKVITKLGDISPVAIKNKKWNWEEFWYSVHLKLCLAEVEPDVYNTAIRLVALRVAYPEDFRQLIMKQQERARKKASDKEDEYWKLTKKWTEKGRELDRVHILSQKYLVPDEVVSNLGHM